MATSKAVKTSEATQPASLRDEFKRLTRERLIQAATELFEKQGFRATTVQQIAKRAGTTHTTFYQHFRSKADLVRLFRDEVSAEIRATMVELDKDDAPTWADIRAWVDEYAQMWRRTHVRCEALWDAMGAEPELAADVIPDGYEITGNLTRLLKRYPAAQRLRVQNKLMLLLLLMDRLCFLLHSKEKKSPSATLQDDMADLIWTALRAPVANAKASVSKKMAAGKKAPVKKTRGKVAK